MEILEKKVSMTELFYDLVFVCAIGKMTHILHHLHNGIIEPLTYMKYLIVVISWINVWMIQAVFNNRYGNDDIIDQLFLFFDMFLLIFLLNSTDEEFKKVFFSYNILIVMITFSQIGQYARQFFKKIEKNDIKLIKNFIYILLIKAITTLVGVFLTYEIGIILVIIGTLISWLLPLTYIGSMKETPVNFPNLVERLTLLIILTFGETIVGIVPYFQIYSFMNIFFIFSMVISLFYYYKMVFDNIIEHHNPKSTGVALIYFHYMIFVGIEAVTVSINFLNSTEANNIFMVSFLYAGLLAFYSGILLQYKYNKESHKYSKRCIVTHYIILLLAYLISLYMSENHYIVLIISTAVSIFAAVNIWNFNKNCMKAFK